MKEEDRALADLLGCLKSRGYSFTAVTPASHARVIARDPATSPNLRDIFGWNRPFSRGELEPELMTLLESGQAIHRAGERLRSSVRVASLGNDLFLHSAFPTDSRDSVFFGPDTYRFAHFIRDQLPGFGSSRRIVDMGAGSGAGGIVAARTLPGSCLTLVDVNPAAVRFSRINAAAAGVPAELLLADRLPSGPDLILANPPYMIDSTGRSYRAGGGLLGGSVALAWVQEAVAALRPDGAMLLYCGAAVTAEGAPLLKAIEEACEHADASLAVREIDVDIFGEELVTPAYRDVERIAAFEAVIRMPRSAES